jgi:anti-sigma B factor antagonist
MIYTLKDGNVMINLRGELDIANADVFKKNCLKIADEHKAGFVIDCRELTFIDSTALGAFVAVNKKIMSYDKKIIIKNLKPNIKKLFTITNLDKTMEIAEEQ